MSGLINYYGRTPESDNIVIKPVLLQKGNTKLALYGMSNVRDERLNHTFRDGKVKFFQPGTQKDDWFNIMSVHQNHHQYTENGWLPESYLPDFLDLVVWGHEHECLIDPRTNPETNFRVMQPGSSVATSLVLGEAVEKKVAILSVKGKDMDVETIRLKTVRPFIYKDIKLSDRKRMRDVAFDNDNKSKLNAYLTEVIQEMITEAKESWLDLQRESGEELDEDVRPPLPLIRLRVEYTAPEGGEFQIDNAQRFSNRFNDQVANTSDVVQFHRKRATAARSTKAKPDMPEEHIMAQLSLENVKVSKLVEEFLTAQSLSILPQNQFSESVTQFVDKDDKHGIEQFIAEAMEHYNTALLAGDEDEVDEEAVNEMMEQIKASLETAYDRGELQASKRKGSRKPKPEDWDSDFFGRWEDNVASIIRESDGEEEDEEEEDETPAPKKKATRGRGGKAAAGSTRKTAAAKKAPAKKPAAKSNGRGKKKQVSSEEESEAEEDNDVIMLDDDDDDNEDDEESPLFVRPDQKPRASKATTTSSQASKTPAAKTPAPKPSTRNTKTPASSARQSQLTFSSQANGSRPARAVGGRAAAAAPPPPKKRLQEPSEDEISDDDAFEPPPPPPSGAGRGGRR